MKLQHTCALVLALCVQCAYCALLQLSSATQVNPVQKVLQLLTRMKVKGTEQMEAEAKLFMQYEEWADDRTKEVDFEIETGNKEIYSLTATIIKGKSDVATLTEDVESLIDDKLESQKQREASMKIRDTERQQFETIETDYTESVDALTGALKVLQEQDYDRPQAEVLLQRMASHSLQLRSALSAALEEDDGEVGAPAVAAYKFQSSNLVDMLTGLKNKFEQELDAARSAEASKMQTFDLHMQHLDTIIKQTDADLDGKKTRKAMSESRLAKAEGQLGSTQTELAKNEQFKADVAATLVSKRTMYTNNQNIRKEELETLGKAISLISKSSVSSSYGSPEVSLKQVSVRPPSLFQTRGTHRMTTKHRAAQFLQRRSKVLRSEALASAAEAVQADPFAKVVGMLEDLLARLKDQATTEADHKEWCDKQMQENKMKRDKETTQKKKLSAQLDELTGSIGSMRKEIEVLLTEIADLTKAISDATDQRRKEKAENKATIKEANAGSAAVKNALILLEKFYGQQVSMMQLQDVPAPQIKKYIGMQGSKDVVIGLLKVIHSDLLRLESETSASETQAESEFKSFSGEAAMQKSMKEEMELKLQHDKDDAEAKRNKLKKDLADVQESLIKANEYFEQLKPDCVAAQVSYSERAAQRQEEIEALKKAYSILNEKSDD